MFKALGFKTLWVSEQAKFSGLNTLVASIANEAKDTVFQDNTLEVPLSKFKDYFNDKLKSSEQNSLSLFHMVGSHFPYELMYPQAFRRYTPTCPPILPEDCNRPDLINTYDNTIFYTDYFLAKVIESIRDKNAIMLYVSDHGEYLGEHGRYSI